MTDNLPENTGTREITKPLTRETMMMELFARGDSLENIEKMMELQERFEKNEAKKAYVKAMSLFKAKPPKISKDKHVGFGNTNYSHASLGNVTEKINKALAENGMSSGWHTDQTESKIKVTCTITHELGHSESTSLEAPADSSGKKNFIQAIGSTVSYLERYTILALTGLATHDQDNDGSDGARPKEKTLNLKKTEELGLRKTEEWQDWINTKGMFPEIVNGWDDPLDKVQCGQAEEQVKKAVAIQDQNK